MSRLDELRLITKVANLYYGQKMRQTAIAKQLNLSQASISRFLQRAQEEGIVRITVNMPQGIFVDLEHRLVQKFGLHDAIVTDGADDEENLLRNLGGAAAYYVETTIRENQVVGLSSWSETLLATVDAMHGVPPDATVVQILGSIGNRQPRFMLHDCWSVLRSWCAGTATHLPAPGVLGSEGAMGTLIPPRSLCATRFRDCSIGSIWRWSASAM